jgi:Icc-related predicted phosphoesterase
MEHVVQIGIGIDDEAIKASIVKNIEKTVLGEVKDDINKMLFNDYGYYNRGPSKFLTAQIEEFLEKNKDDILEMAAEKLADKLSRTKKAKEMLSEVLEKI